MIKKISTISIISVALLLSLGIRGDFEENWLIHTKRKQLSSIDDRINSIVLHYTALNNEKSLYALTQGPVSSHYLITDRPQDSIYNLVDESDRAWHAGTSSFFGRNNINDTSLGIEIVNLGYRYNPKEEDGYDGVSPYETKPLFPKKNFQDYDMVQIEKTAYLLKKMVQRYNIDPTFILGHSDVSPGRKIDPGPKFPWKYLYEKHNLGAWYEEGEKNRIIEEEGIFFKQLSPEDIKREFEKYGYTIPEGNQWDPKSVQVVAAFQMHFRPEHVDGVVDLETYAILKALNNKYR